MFAGCTQAPNVDVEYEPPKQISTDFGRLPAVLEGIRKSGEVVLHEGLPSEFWEPQLREQEMSRKKTIRLHGYPFYDERLALGGRTPSDSPRFSPPRDRSNATEARRSAAAITRTTASSGRRATRRPGS